VRPDLIVETGTADGGSALFFAGICELLGSGRVMTIDTVDKDRPAHGRVPYVTGSSTNRAVIKQISTAAANVGRVMVVLDSDHSADRVHAEFQTYAPLVTPGSYLIVEDTTINGHPVLPEHGPGPAEALAAFLAASDEFLVDERPRKVRPDVQSRRLPTPQDR
jgi:cephalosporin hydroxylase